ncbi:MAG: SBBP repeat-containing protein [Acidobacteria bacterium]|nr:SBBP repeat-containing protein [Acidobacteriota bacterium]
MRVTLDSRRIRFFFLVCLVTLSAPAALPLPARSQTIEWIRQFGTTGTDYAYGVFVDTAGVYVVGRTDGTLPGQTNAGSFDAFARKYDVNGSVIWTRQFGSASNDDASGAVVDATGVYVVGETSGSLPGEVSAGGTDAYVRKYDSDGNEQWTWQFGSSGEDSMQGVAADATGIYVVGNTSGVFPGQTSAGGADAYVRKYDPNGNERWTRQFGSTSVDSAWGVAADATAIYVGGVWGSTDAFVRKYDTNGNMTWTRVFSSTRVDGGRGVAVDATGLYVVGETNGTMPGQTSLGDYDAFVRKYDANGTEQWTRQFGSAAVDFALGVAADATGAYLGGLTEGTLPGQSTAGGRDAFVRNYEANGSEQWTRQFGSTGSDSAAGVASDTTGVYVVGDTFGPTPLPGQTSAGGRDAFVAKIIPPPPPLPAVNDGGVVNNSSFAPSPAPVAPGSIAAVFGSNLNNGSTVLFSSFGPDGKLVTSLGGASATINNIAAPMFYSTPGQLGVQIPFELAGQTSAQIVVTVGGQTSVSRTIFLDVLAPGIFTANNQGTGAAAVLHEDGVTPVTAQSPARPGEVVVLFATGLGALTPALATGAPSTGNTTVATPTVTVDGVTATVEFSGAAPGFAGLNQVNVKIPPNTRTALDIPVALSIGGRQSNPVTIAVAP